MRRGAVLETVGHDTATTYQNTDGCLHIISPTRALAWVVDGNHKDPSMINGLLTEDGC